MANHGDWQLQIYLGGLSGVVPELPMSYAELERRAHEAMSEQIWSYVTGGAGSEHTQRANVAAFERWGLMPRVLRGASQRDLSVELFGTRYETPLMLAPVGVIGLCEPEHQTAEAGLGGHGDLVTARASAATGVPMVASTLMQDPLEDVAAALGDTPGWFQLYPPNDPEVCESLVRRADAAGWSAIVVTLDTLTLGWRPRDLSIASFPQLQGLCLANYFSDPVFRSRLERPPEEDVEAATGLWALTFGNPGMSWDDLDRIRSTTDLPLLLKGVCDPEDVRRARDHGVDGIWCSNHGGRQADGGLPALECLPDVVDAAGDAPVVFDSGIRSGADVVKAIALGATAVGIGRPYAYGMAVGGQAGVEHVLRCLLAETDLIMAVDGYGSLAELTREALRRVG
ncbi:alpha-hydroxy-acid oxidizing protein [Dermatobacter hominis]|uniref:alpha-hydroxy-acid oxidizing protein n=1 Tax=Dermatobacter hominis TaxID=2884263 RepID=UPI001D127D7C|nr:alpha-hydroxy-acid oxidizing protein [Dermatobacter hominis]UDY35336.1 alpha-hydroxy-acid oxidizing protein [Dermatobacter hominis]